MIAPGAPAHRRFSMSASGGPLELRGEFDMAASEALRVELLAHASVAAPRVEVDCRAVYFMDSSGLKVLLDVQEQLRPAGSTLVLTHVPPMIRRTIAITRLHDHLDVE